MTNHSERKIVIEERPEIPWLSVLLGFGPMLPIVAGAILAWAANSLLRGEAILLTVLYSASILAFLAGVRRGLSFRTEGGPALAQLATMAGLWMAAFLALVFIVHAFAIPALALLAAAYLVVLLLDPLAASAGQAPAFFARLRPPQMLLAVLALVAMLVNTFVHG